ncbi:hypothetical protein M758_1G095900 [Ceratodon purpureus]|nr:hypothetical protein M758_1G095900 [Ceratodon purpureus]
MAKTADALLNGLLRIWCAWLTRFTLCMSCRPTVSLHNSSISFCLGGSEESNTWLRFPAVEAVVESLDWHRLLFESNCSVSLFVWVSRAITKKCRLKMYAGVAVHHGRSEESSAVLQATEVLFDKLQKEAYEVAMVKTERRIMEGEPGKVICHESARLEPVAVVMGCRGRGVVKSVLLGSVSEYCTRHCLCPVIIVPHKGTTLKT